MTKSYFELLNEITQSELYEGLVRHGLFAEKLPPIFQSATFFEYCKSNPTQLNDNNTHEYIYYENVRNINIPRPIGIPNPFAYNRLCQYLSEKWDVLLKHFQEKTISHSHKISRIHPRKIFDEKGIPTNRLFEMNFKNLYADGSPESKLLIGKRFIVNADISKCFPSIYTHSLAWAFVGKQEAKRRQNEKDAYFNVIDKYTRGIKHGETDGLLIGPHVSNLLAEIVLVEIDRLLFEKKYQFIRNIDDYCCYTESYEEAQSFISDLITFLRMYDLALNHGKTSISELPIGLEKEWKRKLSSYVFPSNEEFVKFPIIRNYLDYAIKITHDTGDSAVLNYAIKVVSSKENLSPNAREYFVDTIFFLSILYPYLIPLVDEYVFLHFNVDGLRKRELSNFIYEDGIKRRNFEACDYALVFCLKYHLEIDNIADAKSVIGTEDCIFMLLSALYYKKVGENTSYELLLSHAESIAKSENDFDRYWLFVYEMVDVKMLKPPWSDIKNAGISFITDNINTLLSIRT